MTSGSVVSNGSLSLLSDGCQSMKQLRRPERYELKSAERSIANFNHLRSITCSFNNYAIPIFINAADELGMFNNHANYMTNFLSPRTSSIAGSTGSIHLQPGRHDNMNVTSSLTRYVHIEDNLTHSQRESVAVWIKEDSKFLLDHDSRKGIAKMKVNTESCMCYLLRIDTLLWHSCVDLNGICSSRREEAFASRINCGTYHRS